MLKLKIREKEVIIDFEHHNNSQNGILLKPHGKIKSTDERSYTICFIDFGEKNQVSAKAILSLTDNFNKAKGRAISLKKSLKLTDFNKSERKTIWNEYLKKCKI